MEPVLSTQNSSSEGHLRSDNIRDGSGVFAGNISGSNVTGTHNTNNFYASNSQDRLETQDQILDWLCPHQIFSALTSPAEGQNIQDAHANAGKSFIESPRFEDWLAGKERKLWGTGPPGAGKTFLVSRIQHEFRSRDIFKSSSNAKLAVLYMHFQGVHTAADLLACVLRQFINDGHQGYPEVEQLRSAKGKKRCIDVRELAPIVRTLAQSKRLCIVIDAWDECEAGVRGEFLKQLMAIQGPISTFITSRFTTDTENSLSGFFRVKVSANENDVRDYVSHCIANSSRLRDFVLIDKRLESDIKKKLIDESGNYKSGRIFLLVRLHMESLQAEVLLQGVRQRLETLKNGLTEKYREIIGRINGQDPDRKTIAVNALTWITHARRPLRDKELQHALAVWPEDWKYHPDRMPRVNDIIEFSCGMVVLDDSSSTFRLVHNTAQEFMEGLIKNDSLFKDPHTTISLVLGSYLLMPALEEHVELVDRKHLTMPSFPEHPLLRSTQYVGQDAYQIQRLGYADLRSPNHTLSQDKLTFLAKLRAFQLAEYAAVNLGYHLRKLEDTEADSARDALEYTHQILSKSPKKSFYERLLIISGCYPLRSEYGVGDWRPGKPPSRWIPHRWLRRLNATPTPTEECGDDHIESDERVLESRQITSLHLAAHIGIPRLLISLLGDGSLVQTQDYEGFSPLGIALCSGNSEVVLPLLKAGSTLDLQSREGCHLLLFAARRHASAEEVVHHILQQHLQTSKSHRYPIIYHFTKLCRSSLTQIRFYGWWRFQPWRGLTMFLAQFRVFSGFKLQIRATETPKLDEISAQSTDEGFTTSDIRPFFPPRPVAKTLSQSPSFAEQKQRNYLQLVAAVLKGDCVKIKSLISDGTVVLTPHYCRGASKTDFFIVNLALFLAIERDKMEVIQVLIEHGVSVESQDYDGRRPLHRAVEKKNIKLVEFLINHKAAVDAQDLKDWTTPWAIAARNDDHELCRLLVRHGADVNTVGSDGMSVLYGAAAGGHDTTVQLLLQQGANPSIRTSYGWAPLHWAASNGKTNCVRMLLEAGADVNPLSDTQKSPLDMVLGRPERAEIEKMLREKGAMTSDELYARRGGIRFDFPHPISESSLTAMMRMWHYQGDERSGRVFTRRERNLFTQNDEEDSGGDYSSEDYDWEDYSDVYSSGGDDDSSEEDPGTRREA